MFTLSESLPNEGWCAKVLRNVRWNSFAVCPHCNSLQVKKMGIIVHIKRSTFAKSVKGGLMIKQVQYFIIHTYTIEGMVLGTIPILCTMAWMFYT